VPYAANIHDELGLELALRLLVDSDMRRLTILRVAPVGQTSELSYEFRTLMEQLPSTVGERIDIQIIQASEPIQVVEASAAVDLTIAGMSRAWGIERQTLGRYTDQLAIQCRSSLLLPAATVKSPLTSPQCFQVQTAKRLLTQTSLSWSMSSHFNLKSLTFMAIGFVLLLFNVVTAIGKPNSKLLPLLTVAIASILKLPNCLNQTP